jgi:serine/threonine-protein kinase
VLREVAWALAHAHSHGLVHRDVKPDNILLEFATDRVLVADFGIAAATHEISGSGISGTPEFMSPEQALGQELDARSDVYALGVTGFYTLCGKLPFEGASATEILAKQVTEPAPPLASMGVPVARKVAALVDRCLAKKPGDRPPSADAVAEQLGVALEHRKQLPAALRAFVKRSGRLDGGGTLLAQFGLLAVGIGIAMRFGVVAGSVEFLVSLVSAPFAYFAQAARRLLKLGFTHRDIGPAFAAEIEQSRDEHAADSVPGRSVAERVLLRMAQGSLVSFGVTWIAWVTGMRLPGPVFRALYRLMPGIPTSYGAVLISPLIAFAALTAGSTLCYLSLVQRKRDIDTDFWAKVWTGRIGKAAFAVARRFVGTSVRASAVTHRATELSLGMAAESLFESLPQDSRRALAGLPDVVQRLQDDAQRLRKLYDELQDALAVTGGSDASVAYESLRADRDHVHAKLGAAVGALETIRLNLLRLHAGSGSTEGLTTHINLAAEVSAEVERILSARDEVNRTLAFPHRIAVTPA